MCANTEGSGAVSPEPSLFAYAIGTNISCAGSFVLQPDLNHFDEKIAGSLMRLY